MGMEFGRVTRILAAFPVELQETVVGKRTAFHGGLRIPLSKEFQFYFLKTFARA